MAIPPFQSMDVRMAIMERVMEGVDKILADQESRLRKLERFMMYGSGAVGLFSLILHFMETIKK